MLRNRDVVATVLSVSLLGGCASVGTSPAAGSPESAGSERMSATALPSSPASASQAAPRPTPFPHTVIDVERGVGELAVTDGSVWVNGESAVTRLDAVTDEVLAVVELDGWPHGITADGMDVWVTVGACAPPDPTTCDDGDLVRIDAATNEVVQRIPIGTWGYAIAVHSDTVWVSSFEDGLVVRVDAAKGEAVAEIPIKEPTGIAAGADAVWTPRHYTGLVARIDPVTNQVTEFDTGTMATEFVALTDDAVWVTAGDRSLEIVVLSRATGEVMQRIAAAWPQGVVVHEGTVWVALSGTEEPPEDSGILAIDADSGQIIGEYPLPYIGVSELAANGDTIWAPGFTGELLKLDVGH